MTGVGKIQEVTTQLNEIKKNIQDKYDKVMGKVGKLQEKLKAVEENAVGQSKQWIDKQKKKIQTKIEGLTKKITEWLKDQMEKAQSWMDKIKEEITQMIADLSLAPVLALTGI